MDIDIGNILYIVITIIAVAVGLSRKNKKPGQGTVASEGSGRPGFMENLERVLNMGQEEPRDVYIEPYEEDLRYEEPPVEVVKPVTIAKSSRSLLDDYKRILDRPTDGESELFNLEGERMTESVEIIDLDYVEGTDYFEIIKNFDAGRAVVYSAIINRLDY